jgi:hypothetical protein
MKKRILGYIFCIIFLSSCNENKVIIYEFNNVFVTRIDEGTESRFYYGKYENGKNLPAFFVKSTFSGFNSGMDAYLIFKPNKVEIYYTMDYFMNVGRADSIKVINNPKASTFNYSFEDKINGKYDSVCRVSNILSREKELNLNNNSKVKATYPN